MQTKTDEILSIFVCFSFDLLGLFLVCFHRVYESVPTSKQNAGAAQNQIRSPKKQRVRVTCMVQTDLDFELYLSLKIDKRRKQFSVEIWIYHSASLVKQCHNHSVGTLESPASYTRHGHVRPTFLSSSKTGSKLGLRRSVSLCARCSLSANHEAAMSFHFCS